MDDYIKREDAIMTAMNYEGTGNAQDASQDIAADLTSIPAADVRENVRGIWNNALDFSNGNEDLECSVCGEWFFSYKIDCDWNFCPNCGADMRGEKYV